MLWIPFSILYVTFMRNMNPYIVKIVCNLFWSLLSAYYLWKNDASDLVSVGEFCATTVIVTYMYEMKYTEMDTAHAIHHVLTCLGNIMCLYSGFFHMRLSYGVVIGQYSSFFTNVLSAMRKVIPTPFTRHVYRISYVIIKSIAFYACTRSVTDNKEKVNYCHSFLLFLAACIYSIQLYFFILIFKYYVRKIKNR